MMGCALQSGEAEQNNSRPTIVSLNPCTDAIAAELAGPDQLLAVSHYSHDPSASSIDPALAQQYAITGGTVEEVLALDPDIVVGDVFMQPTTRHALERLEIQVEIFGIASDVESSRAQVKRMAGLLNAEREGARLVTRIDTAIAGLREESSSKNLTAILWQPGDLVGGQQSLVSELLRAAGFAMHQNAAALGQGGYLPLEVVLSDPPDVLIMAGDTRGQRHEALSSIQQTMRATFDPTLLYCGGPSIIRAAERLREIRETMQ